VTRVKICGVTNQRDLDLVTGLGVDAVGVITGIPSSPRNVSLEMAKTLVDNTPVFTKSVLVMAPESLEEAVEVSEYVRPDAIQIHGEKIDFKELSEAIGDVDVIKPFNVNDLDCESTALDAAALCDAVLIDSSTSAKLGGTGRVHDWDISRRIAETIKPKPLILAGGLESGNVAEAIRVVKPYGVDVCTGTEASHGVKDPEKVRGFLSAVIEADRRYRI
jgi:phosphoribosylanthranilate isomerase